MQKRSCAYVLYLLSYAVAVSLDVQIDVVHVKKVLRARIVTSLIRAGGRMTPRRT